MNLAPSKLLENRTVRLPEEIMAELTKKYKLPEHILEYVIRSQFEFVDSCIRKKQMLNIRLHYLGVFGVSEKRKEKILRSIEKKNDK